MSFGGDGMTRSTLVNNPITNAIAIDPHVHCRDWEESGKATIEEVKRLAARQGVGIIFDMPNTKPPITTAELVERRLATAMDELGSLDGYYLYVGVTADPDQVKDAVRIFNEYPRVIGLKMFAGKSVGDLAVIKEEDQRIVYGTLADAHYDGVLAVHCEHEDFSRLNLWIPERPSTWNLARPPEMEIRSVKNQIKFACDEGFAGHLHVCHASVPQTVWLVDEARARMRISCGVTPHHLLHSTDEMQIVSGMKYKVNPPLRNNKMRLGMWELLRHGKIDWIESDHAPHEKERKTYNEDNPKEFYMSGIRSLKDYDRLLRKLRKDDFSVQQIYELTNANITAAFPKIVEAAAHNE
jgi:dihydroorotase